MEATTQQMGPMMDQQVTHNAGLALLQYGAIGAILLIFLGLFLWVFYKLVNHLLTQWSEQWKQITIFMDEQVKALQAVRESITNSEREIISEFRAYHREPTSPRLPMPPVRR
jgi:hypothetical protein